MNHTSLARHALVVIVCLATAACALLETRATEAPPVPSGTAAQGRHALSEEARAALAQAEADIQRAREAFALWTTADAAFNQAKAAAELGDSGMVIAQSRIVAELVQLGLAQKSYPSTEITRRAP